MKKKYIMGIDVGTQSTKVTIFDFKGNVICEEKEELVTLYCPSPGVVEHPQDTLWESLKLATKRVLAKFNGNTEEIIGVGICAIRCCRVHLKKDGSLADNVISWMDLRIAKPYEHTNSDVAYVCQTSGYLTHRLTGEFNDTYANYEGNWPIDIQTEDWSTSSQIFEQFNIPREMLFNLKKPGEILGYITKEVSGITGLLEGIPVIATSNDKGTESLGTGILPISQSNTPETGALGESEIDEGTIVLSLGTYISALAHGYKYIHDSTSFWTTSSSVPSVYLYESMFGVRRGMWTITWFKNLLNIDLLAKAESKNISAEEYLGYEASSIPPGSDGLMVVLDWLAPVSAPYKKGMMLGFDIRHTRAHIYRAILEAIALTMHNIIMPMFDELKVTKRKLIVSGGGSNSQVLMQILADVFGLPVSRNVVNGAAGVGSAICVAIATGIYPDFKTAVKNMVKIRDTFIPLEENYLLYKRMNEAVYSNISTHTDEILKSSYNIFS